MRDVGSARRRPWSVRLYFVIGIVGRVLFLVLMSVVLLVSGILGVASVVDAGETVYWGTFTSESCEPARYGCRAVGTWTSDDRSMVKHDIYLDGPLDADGTARASFRPTGLVNDEMNNIVHTSFGTGLAPWIDWVLFVIAAFWTWFYASKWHGERRTAIPRHLLLLHML